MHEIKENCETNIINNSKYKLEQKAEINDKINKNNRYNTCNTSYEKEINNKNNLSADHEHLDI